MGAAPHQVLRGTAALTGPPRERVHSASPHLLTPALQVRHLALPGGDGAVGWEFLDTEQLPDGRTVTKPGWVAHQPGAVLRLRFDSRFRLQPGTQGLKGFKTLVACAS